MDFFVKLKIKPFSTLKQMDKFLTLQYHFNKYKENTKADITDVPATSSIIVSTEIV